jgi:hypothetical protein
MQHFRKALAGGKRWHLGLLEAIGLWTLQQEVRGGQRWVFLIDGEAFDWLLLAQRLLEEVGSPLPEAEVERLLLEERFPQPVSAHTFKRLIGAAKHRAWLNYWYGVVVEQALQTVVEEEVYKERASGGRYKRVDVSDEVFEHIYGEPREALLGRFRREKGLRQGRSLSYGELKEFTYWLSKLRLVNCEKARVASDTRKALEWLERQGALRPHWPTLHSEPLAVP